MIKEIGLNEYVIIFTSISHIINKMIMKNLLLGQIPKRLTKSLTSFYHEKVIDHYENPRNVGSLDKGKKNVGTGLVGAPACGDVMKLQI